MDQPWLRKPDAFRHRLPEWALLNRAELVRACLILCRAWIAAGKHEAPSRPTLGMFESWARVMGGILHACHLPGFLANLPEFYERLQSVPNLRTADLADAGHMLHHDQPQLLALLVENFMKKSPTPP